jgi:hypothetical protein
MREILLRFAEASIPVLVVSPPANEFTEAYYVRVSKEARKTVGPAASTAGIFFLESLQLWPKKQFSDPLHLHPSNNESYRAWLSEAIVAILGN